MRALAEWAQDQSKSEVLPVEVSGCLSLSGSSQYCPYPHSLEEKFELFGQIKPLLNRTIPFISTRITVISPVKQNLNKGRASIQASEGVSETDSPRKNTKRPQSLFEPVDTPAILTVSCPQPPIFTFGTFLKIPTTQQH